MSTELTEALKGCAKAMRRAMQDGAGFDSGYWYDALLRAEHLLGGEQVRRIERKANPGAPGFVAGMFDFDRLRRASIRSHAVNAAEQAIVQPLMSRGEAIKRLDRARAVNDFALAAQFAILLAAMENEGP